MKLVGGFRQTKRRHNHGLRWSHGVPCDPQERGGPFRLRVAVLVKARVGEPEHAIL